MPIQDISIEEKVCRLISELKEDLVAVDRQEKLKIIDKAEAASIRRSIQRSIDDLRTISGHERTDGRRSRAAQNEAI